MKVLITGGSGFLGINMIRFLLEKGIETINVLDIADFNYPEKNKVFFVKGDIRNREDVRRAMDSCNYVIHAAAALPLYPKSDIFSTNINGTNFVLEEAFLQNVERFIHISTTAVYGIPDHHPLLESDRQDGVGPYGQSKIAAEQLCLRYREKGLCVPIIRPKSFIGPERLGVFALFYEWASEGRGFPLMGSGKNRYQFLDIADLCEAIFLTMTGDKARVNDVFNIGAKEFTTMKADYQVVLDAAGFGKKIKTFPAAPMIWTLRFLEFLHLSPLYKWVYETASKDSFVSIEKAEKILGYSPQYSNKDALLRNYSWYLANKDRLSMKDGISHRVPWKQGALKLFKKFF